MRPATYYILASLVGEPLHGYAIAKRANDLSSGTISVTAGTLYGALDRLVDQGLITVEREETVKGRKRRYYRLNDSGLSALGKEAEAMRTAADVVDNLLAMRPGGAF